MVTRAIWPLAVYYPGSAGFTALVTNGDNANMDDIGGCGGKNLLAIDALEYAEISCVKDKTKRMCTRTSILVPWTPVLYVAIRSDHISQFRRRLNCRLAFNNKSPVVAMTRCSNVHSLVRCSNRVLWTLNDMELHELRFDSYSTRNVASRYLRDNAHARAHQYSLFASDSTCFEVALTSYFRRLRQQRDSDANNEESCDAGDSAEDDRNEERDGDGNNDGVDLRKVFEMGVWCKIDDSCDATAANQYIERMTDREIRRNQLPIEPLNVLPVISYDIETIARLDSTLPRGVEEDQRLSSVAITVHHRRRNHRRGKKDEINDEKTTMVPIYLAYVPTDESDKHEMTIQRKLRDLFTERTTVKFYRSERDLLRETLRLLSDNEYFTDLYRLDDPSDSARLACLLIGYNDWEYDYTFLMNRAIYHGMYEEAFHMLRFYDEPRFCFSQLSLDLMKHVRARYAAQLGSFALKHVSAYFGANDKVERSSSERSRREKMSFDAVAIRRMYFNGDGGEEVFDSSMAFDDLNVDRGVNMLRVSLYNLQDCTAVYYLMENLSLLPSISLYARHFYATLWDSSHAGNSKLLPNAFVVRSLLAKVILPFRKNEHSLLAMPPLQRPDDEREEESRAVSSLISPCSPVEITSRWQRSLSGEDDPRSQRYYDQVRVMRINENKLYIGGINSAASGHYVRPICLDFVSFYPSIGCQYELSMETVYIVTCDHLLRMYEGNESLLDQTMTENIIRCFDYEPTDSPYRCAAKLSEDKYRGRDALAAATIGHNNGWYEGVEFTRFREIAATSVDLTRRRVLVIRPRRHTDSEPPIICSLWKHYLRMRKLYKTQMRETTDEFQRRNFSCKEKMVKVVANSLYGYLNYAKSMVYSPQVAAAITLLSRKTFHETAWICQKALPAIVNPSSRATTNEIEAVLPKDLVAESKVAIASRKPENDTIQCDIVYRDTDGLILFIRSTVTGSAVNADQQREYERVLPLLINGTFSHYGYSNIKIDLEDRNVETCCIMGKKKYWKCLANNHFVTKGFEKNAQSFVKHIVRVLQINVASIVASCDLAKCHLTIENYQEFFVSLFTALDAYYATNGPSAFSFNLALNPRCSGGAEADFIQNVIERYDYSPGDRVTCVFVLDRSNPEKTTFSLLRNFRSNVDRLNYYKIIRRLVMYFVQLTEGFKCDNSHSTASDANENSGDDEDDHRLANFNVEKYRSFDSDLREAYGTWLNDEDSRGRDGLPRAVYPMDALFEDNVTIEDNRRREYWLNWIKRNSSLLRIATTSEC